MAVSQRGEALRQRLTALVINLLVIFTALPASADPYSPTEQAPRGYWGKHFVDDTGSSIEVSRLSVFKDMKPNTRNDESQFLCTELGTAPCELPGKEGDPSWALFSMAIFPVCSAVMDRAPCVQSVWQRKGADIESARFIRSVSAPTFARQPSLGLPEGGTVSLWQLKDAVGDSAASALAVKASVSLGYIPSTGKVFTYGLKVSLVPYTEKTGSKYQIPRFNSFLQYGNGRNMVGLNGGSPECIWTETGVCGFAQDLLPDSRLGVSLRVPNELSGWLRGRLKDPAITVQVQDQQVNVLSVEALPVVVPRYFAKFPVSAVTDAIRSYLYSDDLSQGGNMTGDVGGDYAMKEFLDLVPVAGDKADGKNTVWFFGSADASTGNTCLTRTNSFVGLVTTNAMFYSTKPPEYVDGFLTYKVAGTHFDSEGTVNQGTYDLILSSDAARCLYGFSAAPISATISITYADQESRVATTVVSEKGGWLKLAAYGFTFSQPTLKVLLQQVQPVVVTPEVPVIKPQLDKRTITCMKGKLLKKVIAAKPRCPIGYKLKR